MRVLLDTHTLLWWLFDDARLSRTARSTIADPGNDVLVSSATAWEVATKHRLGKLPEAGDVPQRLPEYLERARFSSIDVAVPHALLAGSLPGSHEDPFDRILIAQARIEQVPVVTTDPVFKRYEVEVLW